VNANTAASTPPTARNSTKTAEFLFGTNKRNNDTQRKRSKEHKLDIVTGTKIFFMLWGISDCIING
jgi:hypothetical protein